MSSSQNYFTRVTNQTVTAGFIQPKIGSPVGTLPIPTLITNYTPALQQQYITTFANVITNYYSSNSTALLQTITTGPKVGAPAGTIATTTNYQTVKLNIPVGSYYSGAELWREFVPGRNPVHRLNQRDLHHQPDHFGSHQCVHHQCSMVLSISSKA